MQSVAHSHESSQTMHPLDRARREVVSEVVRPLAELIYQADKGNRGAKLADLNDDCIGVYIAVALKVLRVEARAVRVHQVQQLQAHAFAIAMDESETVRRQARQDAAGHVSHFGQVSPTTCSICRTPIIGVSCRLMLSEHLKQNVHVRCAAGLVSQGKARRLSTLEFITVSENGGQQ